MGLGSSTPPKGCVLEHVGFEIVEGMTVATRAVEVLGKIRSSTSGTRTQRQSTTVHRLRGETPSDPVIRRGVRFSHTRMSTQIPRQCRAAATAVGPRAAIAGKVGCSNLTLQHWRPHWTTWRRTGVVIYIFFAALYILFWLLRYDEYPVSLLNLATN